MNLPMTAANVYAGSDGELTKAFYAELEKRGPIGLVAMNLFRAQKCSARAKVYRGGQRGRGSYRSMAYERKSWSMGLLCEILAKHSAELGIRYGWKEDPRTVFRMDSSWVLYVDLPTGQVSFHSPSRGRGPDYPSDWDGVPDVSAARIILFCDRVMARMETKEACLSEVQA
jgi:hypothetical protein